MARLCKIRGIGELSMTEYVYGQRDMGKLCMIRRDDELHMTVHDYDIEL